MSDRVWDDFRWAEWQALTTRTVMAAPRGAGVYAFRTDASGPLAYVGVSTSINRRLRQWLSPDKSGARPRLLDLAAKDLQFSFIEVEGEGDAIRNAEMAVFQAHLEQFDIPPVFNVMARFGLENVTKPLLVREVGPRDPDGRPLKRSDARAVIKKVSFVEAGLIRWLREKPERLYEIEPRAFEQVVAELFSKQGYEVTLTPQTRDGGKDLYAVKKDLFASFLCIVECKRYAPTNPVDVPIVRSLYGVQTAERAAMSIIATTSRFTSDAKQFHKSFETQMQLREYADIIKWIDLYFET